jgi:hypothetical protein
MSPSVAACAMDARSVTDSNTIPTSLCFSITSVLSQHRASVASFPVGDLRYNRAMSLQNRVDPWGELFVSPTRGTLLGNRGGKFHRDDRTLGARRHVTRAWICCRLEFKGRQRNVWGRGYTELFFLDEVTALAAGHRPCFECRRHDAQSFADGWARARKLRTRPRAVEMDEILHAERLVGRAKRTHRMPIGDLPDGAVIAIDDAAWAVRDRLLLRWSPSGYDARKRRPKKITIDVLTPPAILRVLKSGFRPLWHPTASDP